MKKGLLAILLLCLVFVFASCGKTNNGEQGESESGTNGEFSVGFARADIRPSESLPLAGYGNTTSRMSMGSLDYTYASATVVTDAEGETIAIISLDIISLAQKITGYILEKVEAATGIPQDHIILNCSHSHSTPDCTQTQLTAVQQYMSQFVPGQCAKAVQEAMADRAPAKIFVGETVAEKMNFVRHYLMNDNTYAGDNFGKFTSGVKDYAEEADQELKLIDFRREGKKDVILMNFQCHSQMLGRENLDVSSDWFGVVRSAMEKDLGNAYMQFLQGAAGNLNGHSSRIDENMKIRDYKAYGEAFVPFVKKAYEALEEVPSGKVQVYKGPIKVNTDHTDDARVGIAKDVVEYCLDHFADTSACTAYANANGFNSYYHASGAVSKAQNGKEIDLFIGAFSIGDLGFSMCGAEMFCGQGRFIKENSPFAHTFVLGYSQDARSYLPDQLAYEMNCYEVNISPYAAGTAEKAAETIVEYLNTLHDNLK